MQQKFSLEIFYCEFYPKTHCRILFLSYRIYSFSSNKTCFMGSLGKNSLSGYPTQKRGRENNRRGSALPCLLSLTSSRALERQISRARGVFSHSKAKNPKPFSKWDWVFPASLSIHRTIFPNPVWCTPYFWAATCSPCHWFPISPLQMPSVFAPWLIIKLLNQLLHPRVCKSKHNLQLPLLKCK